MVERLKGTDDAIQLIAGDEGIGKSNLTAGICFYIAEKSNREYNVDNIFFDLDKLIDFATKTERQVIHWDEGALGGLATEWWSKNQQKFMRLLMVARKKKHFIAICIPKFYKLNEYIVVERSIGLIHCYARQNIHKGRFFYFTKKKKELLFEDWKRRRQRSYKKYASFGGSFLEYMPKVFTPEQVQQYEDKKDKAILNIGNYGKKQETKEELDLAKERYLLNQHTKESNAKFTQGELAEILQVSRWSVNKWGELPSKYPFLKEIKE